MNLDLNRALEDLAEAGAARRTTDDDLLTSRVALMTTRIRRRRALRYAGTTAVAACAVGALTVGVAYLPGLLQGQALAPAAASPTSGGTVAEEDACRAPLAAVTGGSGADVQGEASVVSVNSAEGGLEVEVAMAELALASVEEGLWRVFLVDDEGVVVATGEPVTSTAAAGEPVLVTVPTRDCLTGEELSGGVQLVAVVEQEGEDASGATVRVVGTDDSVALDIDSWALPADPADTVFACGALVGEIAPTEGLELRARAEVLGDAVRVTATLAATDGSSLLANAPGTVDLALVRDGRVVGRAVAEAEDVDLVQVTGEGVPLGGEVPAQGCGDAGLEGSYTAVPYVTVTPKELVTAEGEASTPAAEPLLVTGEALEITF